MLLARVVKVLSIWCILVQFTRQIAGGGSDGTQARYCELACANRQAATGLAFVAAGLV
jgi:hypothetical protein